MRKDSKIHGICVVKNEVDVIQYSLQEALKWADYILCMTMAAPMELGKPS
jgi:hypothetical protein